MQTRDLGTSGSTVCVCVCVCVYVFTDAGNNPSHINA